MTLSRNIHKLLLVLRYIFVTIALIFCVENFLYSQKTVDSLILEFNKTNYDNNPQLKINILINIGDALKLSNPDSSEYYYKISYEIAMEDGFDKEAAYILSKIGGAKYILGDYDFALEYFMKSLELSEEISDSKGVAVGLNNMGLIYTMQEKYSEAINYHNRSIEICKNKHDSLLWARNLHNIGITWEMKGEYDSALIYAENCIDLLYKIKKPIEALKVLNLKGVIYLNKGYYSEAILIYQNILSIKDYDNKWEICYALSGMAKAYLSLEEFETARDYGIQSYEIAHEINAKWDLQNITGILSKVYAGLGDWQLAYKYQQLFKDYSDRIFNEEKDKQMAYLQMKRVESENERLANENEAKQAYIENKNLQIWFFSFGVVLLMALIFLLIRYNFLKTQLNKKLREKNKEIDKKNNELTNLNAAKDTILRIIAHDLRSSIGIMISFTDLIKKNYKEYDSEMIYDIINKLHKSSREGFELLENLLEWAQSETGGMSSNPEKVFIKEIIGDIIDSLMSPFVDKKILIDTTAVMNIEGYVNKNMFSAIMRNLISNSLKFTNPGGRITVSASKEGENIRISVIDTGIGIKKENISKLFHFENHFTTRGTHNEKGTGLGLIICNDFIKKMGGRIFVDSEEGKGTTVSFTIPDK